MQIDRVLGNVGILGRGEYNPTEHYEYLNAVSHKGSSYFCVNPDGVTGIEPGTTPDWQLIAEKGDVGPIGPKPVNGVDYNTDEEKEEFKNDIVNEATEEVKVNIAGVEAKAIKNYNDNATQKTTEYDTNASSKLTAYNNNVNEKLEEYNSNATQKTNTFNANATTQTEIFNNNVTSKTNDFNSNASTKTDEFNTNYEEKLESINEASTSIEQERTISDGKYARALKTQVTDVESTQIYAENDVVDDLVINGVELTQVVTENSPSLDNPSEIQVASEQNIQIAKNNLFNIENINTLVNATISNNIITTSALNSYNWFKFNTNLFLLKGTIYLSFDVKINSGSATNINKIAFNDSLSNISNFSVVGSSSISNNVTRLKYKMNLEDNCTVQNLWFQIATSSEAILEVTNIMISYYDVDYEDYYNITNITIPLTNSAIGQYADTIDRENNVQNKVIQELTFTGDENWLTSGSNDITNGFQLNLNYEIENYTGLCNYLKTGVAGNVEKFTPLGTSLYVAVNKTRASTVEEFKALLAQLDSSGNPLKFYLVRVSPTTNSLSEEVQTALSNFKLYKYLNNVSIDGGSMSFIYNKSLIYTINQLTQLVQTLSSEVQALQTPTTEPTVETTSEVQADG